MYLSLLVPALIFLLIVFVLLLRGAKASLAFPALQRWHDAKQWREHFSYERYQKFADYLADEKKFIGGLYAALQQPDSAAGKYSPSTASPSNIEIENGNASFEMLPDQTQPLVGGVLLVHGLSDSPYHMQAVAKIFADKGYYVIGLRLPGHGTAPGALVKVKWKDWYTAVGFAARMVQEKIQSNPQAAFIAGGFSTGGALTLRYALKAVLAPDQRVPDKLFLFSPAIAVTPTAMLANWHKLVAWLPLYEKFRWESIRAEDDPFKYNSFPKNAGDQIHLLTKKNRRLAEKVQENENFRNKMPPIFAYQSPVDATVKAEALLELFRRVGNRESELVWFDVNHVHDDSMKPEARETLPQDKLTPPEFRSRVIVVTNKAQSADPARFVKFYEMQPKPDDKHFTLIAIAEAKTMAWPEKAFALSHVCIPISPADRFYGQESALGRIDPHQNVLVGEKKVLADIADDSERFKRIRYNPFFDFVRERIARAIARKF